MIDTSHEVECVFKGINTYTNHYGEIPSESMERQMKCTTLMSTKDEIKYFCCCLPSLAEQIKTFKQIYSKNILSRVVDVFLVKNNPWSASIEIMKLLIDNMWLLLLLFYWECEFRYEASWLEQIYKCTSWKWCHVFVQAFAHIIICSRWYSKNCSVLWR